jgi:hypothetical protein
MQSLYEKLPVYKKALDLNVYFEKVVKNFDRHHKYLIGADLRNLSRRVVILVSKANIRVTRTQYLAEAIERLEELKVVIRVCQELRVFKSARSFEFSSKAVIDLLKQCEGWKNGQSS